jgi:hypothetical protein
MSHDKMTLLELKEKAKWSITLKKGRCESSLSSLNLREPGFIFGFQLNLILPKPIAIYNHID